MPDAEYILSLSIGQFKAIKKAVTVLMRAGMDRTDAVAMMCDYHRKQQEAIRMYRNTREMVRNVSK